MPKTYEEQLASVQAAIEEVELGAQSTTIQTPSGSRTMTMADLKTLYDRETFLRKMVKRETGGGISYGVYSA